jgi:alkanesulfonate monooxygenase SsuD/methylene tetrahydromethanopterin reductase-like flavin-dependent oxidoreductase (luciferase family)
VSPSTLMTAARNGFSCLAVEGRPAAFRAHALAYQAEAARHGHQFKLGERFGATRSVCLGETREEAFDMAVKTAAFEWHHYFNKFGFAEMWRTEADDPNQPVSFADEAALAKRLIEVGQLLCGTPDDVKRQMEDLNHCHAGDGEEAGELGWLVWQFFQQGTTPLDTQRKQLELFAEHVLPAVR